MANDTETKMPWKELLAAVIGLGLVIGIALRFAKQPELSNADLKGKKASEIDFTLESGQKTSITAQKGKALLLNFWAVWCSPCMKQMPALTTLEQHFSSKGLVVLAFNIEEEKTNVRAKIGGQSMPKNLIFNFNRDNIRPYGVKSIPVSILIDRHGIIREVYKGEKNWLDPQSVREIDDALAD